MIVEDFGGTSQVSNEHELVALLAKRYGVGVNSLWLAHERGGHPALNILIRGKIAYVHYFPEPRHPGFQSVGKCDGLTAGKTSTFCVDSATNPIEVINDAIVSVCAAEAAAKEFLRSPKLPASIEWTEL